MKFLFGTEPDDTHALVVKLALEAAGHQVYNLFTADFPSYQSHSLAVDEHGWQWCSQDDKHQAYPNDFEAIWWRRARKPFIAKDSVHPDDYLFLLKESHLFYESLVHLLSEKSWWINPKKAADRANSKLLQLKLAASCGLSIPITLCSNDATRIQHFVTHHAKEKIIYKPLCTYFWPEQQTIKAVYTAPITIHSLPDKTTLALSAGLFQVEIPKAYELRITCFGDHLVATKLYSQAHALGQMDWRRIPFKEMAIEPYVLPLAIQNKIRIFMRQLGIVFGCFDFIKTPEGEYVFLEVNEQGQFLWIDEYNPEFKLLDTFVQFIQQTSRNFIYQPTNNAHRLSMYDRQTALLYEQNMQQHVHLNQLKYKDTP
ncbi:MAG: hypothetical protein CMF38_05580 [Legionellaceae bacterium]|nr:hypothetical protein [Legionellaceae bacterium]HAF87570.1 hypothetical protein [Legionellales bacterium]HCA88887.1 hypothetical protein [Legionellales bacterium]|tara:strand:- start:1849 stop:2958 length:1110 start_codon:yes stop_codon:yes gene_type:complete